MLPTTQLLSSSKSPSSTPKMLETFSSMANHCCDLIGRCITATTSRKPIAGYKTALPSWFRVDKLSAVFCSLRSVPGASFMIVVLAGWAGLDT
ncbi:uncharacterized protein H6S33_004605 [Morchella sextelata]|uniref:uncharacterized protein n=1 Tax=Morchella sextelata TaxID=1174677 RepID=UPI001D0514BD|nr:uncharacterized protein H6S33_004605 [Morchella sextelata]KAH0605383.1 hypothetical protein H6S33_004605 [Morchella sextelata]